jgi:hypothetical protein
MYRGTGTTDSEVRTDLLATRAVVATDTGYREQLLLVGFEIPGPDDDTAMMTAWAERGRRVVAGPERLDHGFGGIFSGEIFAVRRRSSLAADLYKSRHLTRGAE